MLHVSRTDKKRCLKLRAVDDPGVSHNGVLGVDTLNS
jgi:hypothetical protein